MIGVSSIILLYFRYSCKQILMVKRDTDLVN